VLAAVLSSHLDDVGRNSGFIIAVAPACNFEEVASVAEVAGNLEAVGGNWLFDHYLGIRIVALLPVADFVILRDSTPLDPDEFFSAGNGAQVGDDSAVTITDIRTIRLRVVRFTAVVAAFHLEAVLSR